ncbi:Ionotropic receptor 137 [Cephus cinctus]|uniref:Uncharacterized protein LOC112494029 n=1 Tax=Cephus cinctus TaxID=211228 RepID=A0A3L9LTS7_CEPCN|nr:uncharacterized protein LOC112494029 [Cephus cinctus]RLZ02175.1 Ionotropic receptor 137 [Cephus cinctus]
MFSHGYFTCIIIFLNLYKVVTGDLKKLSCDLKQNQPERVLEKFFLDVENYLMQDCPSRHVTIIAPNNQLLRAATPIFRGRPYFVGTNSKVIVQSREYANENCVFLFSYKIYYDYSILSYLPSDYNTKIHMVSTIDISEDEMKNIFSLASYGLMENVTIIFLQNNDLKAFKVFPYTRNCMREIRLSYIWGPDKGLKTYYYDDDSPRNLNKCSIPISTLSLKSTITVHENPDGTLDILGGPEGNLILTFAETLNFTAAVKYPDIQEWEGEINNTVIGLLGDIANRKSVIAIGQMLPNLGKHAYSDFTLSYDQGCVTWTTPLITVFKEDVLYSEFKVYLWIAVLFSIAFSFVFIYNIPRINPNNRTRQTYIGVALDVICSTLGIPLHRVPADQPGKIYCLSYIFYAMVLTVAYRTSLASILTVRNNVQLIQSVEDIVRLGIIPGGSNSTLSMLELQLEEYPYVSYLVDNYEHIVDTVSALKRIKCKKDFAFVRDFTETQYFKRKLILSGEEVYFHTFAHCIVSYHKVVLVSKGSVLTTELNFIIGRLRQAGFIDLWNRESNNVDVQKAHEIDVTIQEIKLTQLRSIFTLYLSGITLSMVTFILELIFSLLSKYKN